MGNGCVGGGDGRRKCVQQRGQWQQCEEEWLVDSGVERLSPFESISFTLALEREWRMALTNGGLDRG
jgi:hypothetical protein